MKTKFLIALCCIILFSFTLSIYFETTPLEFIELSNHYLSNFRKDTGALNAVASIYLNYRMYDSIFETLMLLVSVSAVVEFTWRYYDEK